jgi:YD repeat-containing protein
MQPPPVRNASIVAASVFSHSGEFSAVSRDLRIPGRGLDLDFIRSYRSSLTNSIGVLGRGWSCNLARRMVRDGDDLLYDAGAGLVHRFAGRTGKHYTAPPGVYAVLSEIGLEIVLEQRFGVRTVFQAPEQGGRLLAVIDRNDNELRFSYTPQSVQIVDTVGRKCLVAVEDDLWRTLTDHAGRSWGFGYDANGLLVEVVRPATRDFPKGTSVTYGYDASYRLAALTDAKGQTYLENRYDDLGRIIRQTHGAGEYTLAYGDDRRTRCRLKHGGMLELDHDAAGHVTRSRRHVRPSAFSGEDLTDPHAVTALDTMSTYSGAGELIWRCTPSGRETRWAYAEGDRDPRNRGNLIEVTRLPRRGAPAGVARITRTFEYAKAFQAVAVAVDPRGNRTTCEYDGRGNLVARTDPTVTIQPIGETRARAAWIKRTRRVGFEYDEHGGLVRRTEVDGAVTEFSYHPDGRLARVIRDVAGARLVNTYGYDAFGNCTEVFDGKGAATRLSYNAMGRVESSVSRAPFEYRIEHHYDANYHEIESVQSFEHLVADGVAGTTDMRASSLREQRSYDTLGMVVERRIVGGDKVVRESFIRDAAGRVVRQIQPLGNVTEFAYDERDLVIEKRFAANAAAGFIERFTYTLDGSPRSRTDGDGGTTVHRYDGFERYQGFLDPGGTMKHQSLDEAGNVVAVNLSDAERVLMEARYRVDELNRTVRIDRAWRDLETGEPAGKSGWDGAEGVVSTVIEYGPRSLPARVWNEGGAVSTFSYDGCARLTELTGPTGEALSLAYDENGNVTDLTTAGPGGRARTALRRSFDAMDRLQSQQSGAGPPERFGYNALGAVVAYLGRSGLVVHHTHDALGRHTGHAYAAPGPIGETRPRRASARERKAAADLAAPVGRSLSIARRYEYDDNNRLVDYVDAAGGRTAYTYDELDRQTSVAYPDGSVARVEYDARGNAVRVLDANGRETKNRYDAAGRLVASADTSSPPRRYTYDGAGRLLLAAHGRKTLRRTYDSLSKVKTEVQGLGTVRLAHDSAGNLVTLVYPSGREVRRTYDARRRVTSVRDGDGKPIVTFAYDDGDRVTRVQYGGTLLATLEYDAQQRLGSVEYRTAGDDKLVAGYRYAYDAMDLMTHEIQVTVGDKSGERYVFDQARRPVRAQYGVQDVSDPASAFEHETAYDYLPEGRWSRRVDRDGSGQIIAESLGAVDRRNRYQRFGKHLFTYDRSGACIRKESEKTGFCLYAYDAANRLIRVDCYDVAAHLIQTIEYEYDALGRLIRKTVTDGAGQSTVYTYAWIGSLLAEEYEDGALARSYVYGIGAAPVRLTSQKAGADFTYILNGRGLVSGLVRNDDPNTFAEKYGYELTGDVFMTEIDGMPVGLPSRATAVSGLDNPLVSGDLFGSLMSDWASGTLSTPGGGHMDTTISDALNALGDVGSKGHESIQTTLANQLNSMLGMLGLGGSASAPSDGINPGSSMNPDWKLYADGDDSDLTPPPLVSANDDGTTTVHNSDGSSSTGSGPASDAPVKQPDPDLTPHDTGSGSSGDGTPSSSGGQAGDNSIFQNSPAGQVVKFAKDAAEWWGSLPATPGFTSGGGGGEGTPSYYGPAVNIKLPGSTKMTDPDAGGGAAPMPSPDELEARFNSAKHPVNPNGGPTTNDSIDTSSPPPSKGGLDPTVALLDPDAAGAGGGGGSPRLDIAPIDHVPGWNPELGIGAPPASGDGGDTTGGPWP